MCGEETGRGTCFTTGLIGDEGGSEEGRIEKKSFQWKG